MSFWHGDSCTWELPFAWKQASSAMLIVREVSWQKKLLAVPLSELAVNNDIYKKKVLILFRTIFHIVGHSFDCSCHCHSPFLFSMYQSNGWNLCIRFSHLTLCIAHDVLNTSHYRSTLIMWRMVTCSLDILLVALSYVVRDVWCRGRGL